MYKIVLVRHGQSEFNAKHISAGWTDVPLTEKGIEEAHTAGKILKKNGYIFDVVYENVLDRCIQTTKIILVELGLTDIPVYTSWKLNERHYGALQGQKHEDTINKYGVEQFQLWRRSYHQKPPALTKDDKRYPGNDLKYANLSVSELPLTESLEDVSKRVLSYWNKIIIPDIKNGKKVLISTSHNALRALLKHIANISDEDIVTTTLETGVPVECVLDETFHATEVNQLA